MRFSIAQKKFLLVAALLCSVANVIAMACPFAPAPITAGANMASNTINTIGYGAYPNVVIPPPPVVLPPQQPQYVIPPAPAQVAYYPMPNYSCGAQNVCPCSCQQSCNCQHHDGHHHHHDHHQHHHNDQSRSYSYSDNDPQVNNIYVNNSDEPYYAPYGRAHDYYRPHDDAAAYYQAPHQQYYHHPAQFAHDDAKFVAETVTKEELVADDKQDGGKKSRKTGWLNWFKGD